jgi:hypothetical protein
MMQTSSVIAVCECGGGEKAPTMSGNSEDYEGGQQLKVVAQIGIATSLPCRKATPSTRGLRGKLETMSTRRTVETILETETQLPHPPSSSRPPLITTQTDHCRNH